MLPGECASANPNHIPDGTFPLSAVCYNVIGHTFALEHYHTEYGFTLNTSQLPAGIYILIMNTNIGIWKERFVVVKN